MPKTEKFELKTRISEGILAELAKKQADKKVEYNAKKLKLSNIRSQYNKEIIALDEEITELANQVHTKHHVEELDCPLNPLPASKRMELLHPNTGEVVHTRPMTADEAKEGYLFAGINDPETSIENAKAFLKKNKRDEVKKDSNGWYTDGVTRYEITFPEAAAFRGSILAVQDPDDKMFRAFPNWKSTREDQQEIEEAGKPGFSDDGYDSLELAVGEAIRLAKDDLVEWQNTIEDDDRYDLIIAAFDAFDLANFTVADSTEKPVEPVSVGEIEPGGEQFHKRDVTTTPVEFDADLDFSGVFKVATDEGGGFHFGYRFASTKPKGSVASPVYVNSLTHIDYQVMLDSAAAIIIGKITSEPRLKTMTNERTNRITKTIEKFFEPEAAAVAAD